MHAELSMHLTCLDVLYKCGAQLVLYALGWLGTVTYRLTIILYYVLVLICMLYNI